MKNIKYSHPATMGMRIVLLLAIVFLSFGSGGSSVALAAPPNDNFANATVISSFPFTETIDTTDATQAGSDPDNVGPCDDNQLNKGNNTVWYQYTADVDGPVNVDTAGTTYDTYIAVWTGTSGNLKLVTCDDDNFSGLHSQLGFNAKSGTVYYIEIAQFNGYEGGTPSPATGGSLTINVGATIQYVSNGGFERDQDGDGLPNRWKGAEGLDLSIDGQTQPGTEGQDSFIFNGDTAKTKKTIAHQINQGGSAGDVFDFSFWAKSNQLPDGFLSRVELRFYNGSGLFETQTIELDTQAGTETYNWTKFSTSFAASEDYTNMRVVFIFRKPSGKLWIDDVNVFFNP